MIKTWGLFAGLSLSFAAIACPTPWQCQNTKIKINSHSVSIRNGFLAENSSVPFRGNVIYYQGLGDSMLNHMPLFKKLTNEGFRVIAFDYMGQGGSSGSMNDTRIHEIGKLGDIIWRKHARNLKQFPHKNIIGWSTGGLAAYVEGINNPQVKKVALIAPGIAPNKIVGEQDPCHLKFNQITLESLTSQTYAPGIKNPHLEGIKPKSPLNVPLFSIDLLTTAAKYAKKSVPTRLAGLVLLSGDEDTYVDAAKTRRIINEKAHHFEMKQYPHTLHEIDNEREPAQTSAHQDIIDFLK